MSNKLPRHLKPYFWSYNFDALDVESDKKRILTQILNLGSKEATDWLFSTYTKEEIADAIENPLPGEWNKKSLHYWSLKLGVQPGSLTRTFS
ncbi:MAG: hypothetical protein WD049_06490 [Candidatus Paceibacterota bacterium]